MTQAPSVKLAALGHQSDWALKAMGAGEPVLCEKPLSMSVEEIARLQQVRDHTGKHIEGAFIVRVHPHWTRLAEILDKGMVGLVNVGAAPSLSL